LKASILRRIARLEGIFKPEPELILDWGRLTAQEQELMKKAARIIMKHRVLEKDVMDVSVLSSAECMVLDEAVIVLERHERDCVE
jgi:hypothetical protein